MIPTSPRARILVGLAHCKEMLARPDNEISPAQREEWQMRMRAADQALLAMHLADPQGDVVEPNSREERNAAMFRFIDSGGAEQYQRVHKE